MLPIHSDKSRATFALLAAAPLGKCDILAIMGRLLVLLFLLMSASQVQGQMTCGPKMSPRLMMEIPCDMSKNNFCSAPGGSYPWSSVRRYIYENQGLMRRMYGDQRQSLILKHEIDDIRDKYNSLSFNGWYGRGAPSPLSGRGQPQFRPRSASVDPAVPTVQQIVPSVETSDTDKERKKEDGEALDKKTPPTTISSPISSPDGQAEATNYSRVTNVPSYSTESTNFTADFADFEDGTTTAALTAELYAEALKAEELQGVSGGKEGEFLSGKLDIGEVSNSTTEPGSSINGTSTASTVGAAPDQPAEDNDFETEPIEKKGVNACPVKEEVIAPYWANNTRGETLALLNVYPFEQYVHWEKCSYENSQMFCRDGCRCEQQYRLHRLLAFDPKNECRGIFADWFRFPSCCVCICYDLPDTSIFYRINRRKSRL